MKAIVFDVDDTIYDQQVVFDQACRDVFGELKGVSLVDLFKANRYYSDESFDAMGRGEMTKEEMYSYFGNVTSLSTFVYSQLPQDFGAIGDALRDAATDNAVYTWNQSSVYNVYNGTWSPLKTVDDVWSNYYTAIREANSFLENYSLEVLERFKWNVDYEIDVEKAKMRVHCRCM